MFIRLTLSDALMDQERSKARYVPSGNKIYIWQTPLMLMSWSWIFFLLAVTLRLASAFTSTQGDKVDVKVATFYFSVLTVVVGKFAWCSFWLYRAAGKESNKV